MAATDLSPNVDNYYVGAGVLKWQAGSTGYANPYRDLGNVSKFEFTSTATRLDHYSSRVGVRFKDKSVVTQVSAIVSMTMDELTAANLAMALLGTETVTGPPLTVDILDNAEQEGALRFIGTNRVGAKMQIDLPLVNITPGGPIGFISTAWGELVISGEVMGNITTGSFGRVSWLTDGVEISNPGP